MVRRSDLLIDFVIMLLLLLLLFLLFLFDFHLGDAQRGDSDEAREE